MMATIKSEDVFEHYDQSILSHRMLLVMSLDFDNQSV